MGQHKTAKEEKQVDREISTAPEPRRRASGKVIGTKTAVEEQHTHCSDPAQRCKRRQFRRWGICAAGVNVRDAHLVLPRLTPRHRLGLFDIAPREKSLHSTTLEMAALVRLDAHQFQMAITNQ
jgi:hypothetical protein